MKFGFSLIELMIVLALVSACCLFSYPSYNHYLIKTRRVCMVAVLLDTAIQMEKYHVLHQTYEGAGGENLLINRSRYQGHYRLDIIAKDNSYLLKATTLDQQTQDTTCGVLTLDQDGNKNASGSGGDQESCWL